jgi:tungstate transport system substrate-binding protein
LIKIICRYWLPVLMSFAVFALPQESLAADGPPTRIRMATTTSTENSGLLDYLLPHFEKQSGFIVDVIAVGTGKALKLAEWGDVDLILVHAPMAEMEFIDAGWGVNRRTVMANDFLLVGPPEDPAGLKKAKSLTDALKTLKQNLGIFVSRGDDSGTHKKERALWPLANGPPQAPYYLETGQGMEATLRIAHEKKAYTLTDRGTFLALGHQLELMPAYESATVLNNPYSVIVVSPARHGHVKYLESMSLVAWMTSPEGQDLIGAFRMKGEVLFHPAAVPNELSE